ncbi:Mitochondrial-processing peptidase subunit alpha [Diatrype stigma]|uniref:Mitochondrial-processing peptidase subunit alpha n=1 Tax=Diatrype stigma TaxID=117547 RepID=A0AAN9URN9_9PEZI
MAVEYDEEMAQRLMGADGRLSNVDNGSDLSLASPTDAKLTTSRGRGRQSWVGTGCLGRLTRKHYFIGLIILFLLMVLWINPYRLPSEIPSQSGGNVDIISASTASQDNSGADFNTSSAPAADNGDASTINVQTGKDGKDGKDGVEKPMDEKEPEFCTTWPVDKEGSYHPKTTSQKVQLDSFAPTGGWKKPKGIKIIAMVFYGRKHNVDILDCYLRQNLASNGGYLDQVWFMVHTSVKDDVEWLRDLTGGEPGYRFVELGDCTDGPYGCVWEYAVDDDTIYIKIDDDILYIHHDAIPQLVHTRLAQPFPFAISAQLINGPVTAIQQYNFGAIHPFLPDPRPHLSSRAANETWRPADMGLYPEEYRSTTTGESGTSDSVVNSPPPYAGHTWLLLSDRPTSTIDLLQTPIGYWSEHRIADIAHGIGWTSWGVAAQSAYSLLHNIALNQMSRYHWGRAIDFGTPSAKGGSGDGGNDNDNNLEFSSFFDGKAADLEHLTTRYDGPGGEQLFDMQYVRYNLNFVAIWGRDVRDNLPIGRYDEEELSQTIPRRRGRPFVIDTRAVVGHHSFFTQRDGIKKTDSGAQGFENGDYAPEK